MKDLINPNRQRTCKKKNYIMWNNRRYLSCKNLGLKKNTQIKVQIFKIK